MKKIAILLIALMVIGVGLSGCIEDTTESYENYTDTEKESTQTARIGDTIPEIGTEIGIHNLSLTLLSWKESNISIDGPYGGEFYTFTAKLGMKFIILIFEFQNNWIRKQTTPYICSGEISTDKGYFYLAWNPPVGIYSEEYNPRKSTSEEVNTLIGVCGSYEELLPEESTVGCVVFEIPEEQKAIETNLAYVIPLIKFDE